MKVLLAGLFHESHSFTDDITGIERFQICRGRDLLGRRGDGSQIDGFLMIAAERAWEVVPTIAYEAMPSGVVDHSVFETFWSELAPALHIAIAEGLDGIFLSLHGAMVTTREADPEGELLRRIRNTPGAMDIPIFGVFDLHANLTPSMAELADGLVCYRENPHIDAFESAANAARMLARCLDGGRRPRMRLRHAPIIWPPTGQATAQRPMSALEAAARDAETSVEGVWAVNVVGGYSFSDVEHAGVAFLVITDGDTALADTALQVLAELAWSMRFEGLPVEEDLDSVLAAWGPGRRGPLLIIEPADNIGGGAPGDCTDVLRALVRHEVEGGGVILVDPAAVSALAGTRVGETTRLAIGGRRSSLDLGPVVLDLELVSRSDGHFTLEDRNSHLAAAFGINIEMGPSAVVRHRGVTILLTSNPVPPFDLGQWRSQGVTPEDLKVVGVKAAVGHRRAYDPMGGESHTVWTRGPCASDPRQLPYRNLRRPIFPLDAWEVLDD